MELLRFKKDQIYLGWDFETCNLNLVLTEVQAPWQLGWQVIKNKSVLESHEDWILWDDIESKMGKDAAAITGFDIDIYKSKAKDPINILNNFEKFLLDENVFSVTANGVNFDQYIYQIYRRLLGREYEHSFATRLIDIQTLAKAYVLGVVPPKIGTYEWVLFNHKMSKVVKKGLKTSLEHLAKLFDVPYDPNRHHKEALYDVELTLAIFKGQLNKIELSC